MRFINDAKFRARLALVPAQADKTAEAARRGLTDASKPRRGGFCEMFARLIREDAWGKKFDFAWLGTARKAGIALAKAGYSVPISGPIQPGDQLYKFGADKDSFGHVGTAVAARCYGILIAENSSIHADDADARGLRTTAEFGKFDALIRLNKGVK